MVVKPKMAQPAKLAKELIDLFSSTDRIMQKPSLYSRMLFRPVEAKPHLVEYESRGGQGTIEVHWSPAMH